MNITRDLVSWCNNLEYQRLPAEVVDKVKYLALDFVGVVARGSIEDSSIIVYELIKKMSDAGKDSTVVIGTNFNASQQYAAMANGTAGHAVEMDDVNLEACLHPGGVIFPAVFASCEVTEADGRRFIESVVIGYEVMVRLGRALNPSEHYARGFHPTATCGTIGATAAVAKVLALSEEQTLNALGISGSLTGGSFEAIREGSWTKRLHPGWSAFCGIMAALLAKSGFQGPTHILEGPYGFLHAHSLNADRVKILENIGNTFQILNTSVKPHACCGFKQGPIDGIIQVMREENLSPEDIEEIKIGISKTAMTVVAEPRELRYNPKTVYEAQFSMPFGAAVAAIYGRASLNEYSVKNLRSSEIREMMHRVICENDPELDQCFPMKLPAPVAIKTKDKKIYKTRIEYPKGNPQNALSWSELILKFHDMSCSVFTHDQRENLINGIRDIENSSNLRYLTKEMRHV
jgi:2-methylcitrate dehydratase PrpD